MNPQTFTAPDGEEMVIITRTEFDAMTDALEDKIDAVDVAETLARIAAGEEETWPAALVKDLINGANPLRVFRKHRGMTQVALAEAAGTTPVYLSQLETGARQPGPKILAGLATALHVDIDDLTA